MIMPHPEGEADGYGGARVAEFDALRFDTGF